MFSIKWGSNEILCPTFEFGSLSWNSQTELWKMKDEDVGQPFTLLILGGNSITYPSSDGTLSTLNTPFTIHVSPYTATLTTPASNGTTFIQASTVGTDAQYTGAFLAHIHLADGNDICILHDFQGYVLGKNGEASPSSVHQYSINTTSLDVIQFPNVTGGVLAFGNGRYLGEWNAGSPFEEYNMALTVELAIGDSLSIDEWTGTKGSNVYPAVEPFWYESGGTPTPGGSTNPYEPGGTSGTGGGNGTFDRTSDPVDFTPLPQLSAARAGLISLFNPSLSELNELSSRLWSKDFLDAITNFFTDPSDIIISLGIVPVQPPISGRADLQAGLISTGISMNVISSQFMSFNCGTLELKPFYDAALDYSPYTKISIYLPYIGVRQLNTDEVMNNTVALRYNIDLFSGACVAEVKVGNSVLYTFNGNVVSQVPISARSYDSLISAVIQGATAIGGAIATGGATAGSALSATVNVVQSAKPEVLRSGNASANIGLLAGQTPYLIFEIPNQSMPENNQTFVGFPANITATLSDLSGYTQVDTVHLENIPATSSELSEIENLLKGGIIL